MRATSHPAEAKQDIMNTVSHKSDGLIKALGRFLLVAASGYAKNA